MFYGKVQKGRDEIKEYADRYSRKLNLDLSYFIVNSLWMILRHAVLILSGLLVTVALARVLPRHEFGLYQLLITIISVAAIFSLPGMGRAITQSVSRGLQGVYSEAIRKSLRFSFLGSIGLFLASGYYWWVHELLFSKILFIAAIAFPFITVFTKWNDLLTGLEKFNVASKFMMAQSSLFLILTLAVLIVSPTLMAVSLLYLGYHAATEIFFHFRSKSYIRNRKKDPEVLGYGMFLSYLSAFGTLATHIDKLIVGVFIGPAELAIYYVISVVALKIKDVAKTILVVLLPRMSTTRLSFWKLVEQQKLNLGILMILSGIASVIFYLAIPFLDKLLFGEPYQSYYHLSRYFAVMVFMSGPVVFTTLYANAKKLKKTLMLGNLVFQSLRIVIVAVGAYFFGLRGIIIAVNLNMILWFVFYSAGLTLWKD